MPVTDGAGTAKGVFEGRIVSNESLCREHWRFVIEIVGFPEASPGQFVQIQCGESDPEGPVGRTLLRRPFSIGGLRRTGDRCEIDILHRAVGAGTQWLSQLRAGDGISILGPLGHPFPIFRNRPMAFVVGGGVGLPPLMWLTRVLREESKEVVAFCGARSADVLPLTRCPDIEIRGGMPALSFREFAEIDTPVVLATDDGTLGAAGRIPDVFAEYFERHPEDFKEAVVYTCGPDLMMQAVAALCEARSVPCWVCLERMMGCGMGTCQSCVVRIRDTSDEEGWRYQLCCTDGPVFDSRVVIWDTHR